MEKLWLEDTNLILRMITIQPVNNGQMAVLLNSFIYIRAQSMFITICSSIHNTYIKSVTFQDLELSNSHSPCGWAHFQMLLYPTKTKTL